MPVPFPDLDPYETLNLTKTATESDIKKSYRKLCLKYHPDKQIGKNESELALSRLEFEKIQFAHLILNDSVKRKRYDQTGSLEDVDLDSGFDWFEYFNGIKTEITQESISKDKEVYQGSSDEEEDIIESWLETKGGFLNLFETIPHTEITNQEEDRLFKKVTALISEGVLESYSNWETYKSQRKKLFNKLKKSVKDESKEADEMKAEILQNKKLDSEDDLRQLIQQRQQGRIDSLISNLESKYGNKKPRAKGKSNDKVTKPGKKKSKNPKSEYDLDDSEFEKIQKKMMKK